MASIVIIDDDEDLSTALSVLLTQRGHEVHSETSGLDGLEWLSLRACDVVILDGFLGDMDGQQVLSSLREKGKTMPVLLLTGESSAEFRQKVLQSGASDCVSKPFSIDDLEAKIKKALAAC